VKRCLSFLLLALALAAPATATATTYGAQVSGDFSDQAWGRWSPAQTMASLRALYAAGGRVGRADSDWAGAERHAPVRGHHAYNWAFDDTIVSEMAQARLRWEPTLDFTPKWAEAHRSNVLHLKTGTVRTPLPPANNANFAAYASAFMRRYGVHGSFWAAHRNLPYLPVTTVEVWNEPDNVHFWGPVINLQDYAKLYETVRSAIRRVNRGAGVVTGGLAWTQSSLPRLLKAFLGKPMDEVAIHPYGATPNTTVSLVRNALVEMRKYGRRSTPVVVNEYGWTSTAAAWGTTKRQQVDRYVYEALIGLSTLRVAQIIPFEWTDSSWGLNTGTFARAVAHVTRLAADRFYFRFTRRRGRADHS
jgi:hypothetical protein